MNSILKNSWAGLAMVALLAAATAGSAATWSAAVNGDWHDSTKWTGGTLPTNGASADLYVDGSYTATINNATVDLNPTTVTNLYDITVGNGAGDNQTLLVNFTNLARNVSARILRVQYGGTPTLNLEQGTVIARRRLNSGYGTSGTGTVRIVGGMLVATQAVASSDWSTIGGNDAAGTGFLDQRGGQVLFDRVGVGYWSGSIGLWTLSGGTGTVSHTFAIGQNAGSTGTVLVAGGVLKDTTSAGIQVGGSGKGTMIVSNGSVEATALTLGYSAGLDNRFEMHGGTGTVSGLINVGRLGGTGGILLMNGGILNATNSATSSLNVGYQASNPSDARLIVSNGTLNATQVSIGGDAGGYGTGAGEMHLVGGLVSVSSNLFAGAKRTGSTGVVEIAGSGLLETKGVAFTLGTSGTGRGYVTNQNGGTIRFTGLNNPTITVNTGSSFVTTNATIEFKDTSAADLTNKISTKITYQGANTLSLNSATNAMVGSYAFGPSPGANFLNLRLVNGGVFRGTNVALHANSVLTVQLGGANLAQYGRVVAGSGLTLAGTLNVTLAPGFVPQLGDSFDLLDWGSLSGAFSAKNLPPGYCWLDKLSEDGTIRVTAAGTVISVR